MMISNAFLRKLLVLFCAFVFFLLILIFLPSKALGFSSAWECDFEGRLKGIPFAVLAFNKDSWEGKGNLKCTQGEEHFESPVQLRYEGWASATGIAGESDLRLFSRGIRIENPSQLMKSYSTATIQIGDSFKNEPVTAVLQAEGIHPFAIGVSTTQFRESLIIPLDLGTVSIDPVEVP